MARTLADFIASITDEANNRYPQIEDFNGKVFVSPLTGEEFGSDELRDMYAAGNAEHEDMLVERSQPWRLEDRAAGRGFAGDAEQQAAIERQLASEGLGDIDARLDPSLMPEDFQNMGLIGPSTTGDQFTIEQLRHMLRNHDDETIKRLYGQEALDQIAQTVPSDFSTDPSYDSSSRFSRTPEERSQRTLRAGVPTETEGGRAARRAFEVKPSRPSYGGTPETRTSIFGEPSPPNLPQRQPSGTIRGTRGDVHMTTMAGYVPELQSFVRGKDPVRPRQTMRMTPKEERFWHAYEQYVDQNPEAANAWDARAGFTTREGEHLNRARYAATHGRPESIQQASMEKRVGEAGSIATARAGSNYEPDQVRRVLQSRRAQSALAALREERAAIEGTGQAERVAMLTKAIGNLKNMAIRRGLMGIGLSAATVGSVKGVNTSLGLEDAYGLENAQ